MRRARLRSNNGCTACRQRHRKCDEARPVCSLCQRFGLPCSLAGRDAAKLQRNKTHEFSIRLKGKNELIIGLTARTLALRIDDGQSEAVEAISCFGAYERELTQTSTNTLSRSLLNLLSVQSEDNMVLFSVLGILVLFMPLNWEFRQERASGHIHKAMARTSKSIAGNIESGISNEIILAATLLYLYALHAVTSKHEKRIYLLAIGTLLEQRSSSSPSNGPQMPLSSLEPFLFHSVMSSTVDSDLILPGTSKTYVDSYLFYLARNYSVDVNDLCVLGVPGPFVKLLFYTACLRKELLTGTVEPDTVRRVQECIDSGDEKRTLSQRSFGDERAIVVLYKAACRRFCQFLLLKLDEHLGLSIASPSSDCADDDEVVRHNISVLAAQTHCFHSLTWPLFVLGLCAQQEVLRSSIQRILRNQVTNCRMASVQHVVDCLNASWQADRGLDTMLDLECLQNIMF